MSAGDERINLGAWLVDHLEDVSRRPRGDITIGGMITIIATALGVDVAGLQVVPGETRINFRSFISMQWVENQGPGNGYLWKVDGRPYAVHSDTNITAIYDEDNRVFNPEFDWGPGDGDGDDDERMEVDEPPRQPQQEQQQQYETGAPQGGWAEQITALQVEFGQLRTDVGALWHSNETMTTTFGQMHEQYGLMTQEFGYLRDELHRHFPGNSSSQPRYDPSSGGQ